MIYPGFSLSYGLHKRSSLLTSKDRQYLGELSTLMLSEIDFLCFCIQHNTIFMIKSSINHFPFKEILWLRRTREFAWRILQEYVSHLFLVGRPIDIEKDGNPAAEKVEEYHHKYIEELTALFDEYKTKYGIPEDTKLIIQWWSKLLRYYLSFLQFMTLTPSKILWWNEKWLKVFAVSTDRDTLSTIHQYLDPTNIQSCTIRLCSHSLGFSIWIFLP